MDFEPAFRFMVRVELHDAHTQDYTNLHSEMAKRGFQQTIFGGNVLYHLPLAEYFFLPSSPMKPQAVLELVKGIVALTKKSSEILVTVAGDIVWHGLPPVPQKVAV